MSKGKEKTDCFKCVHFYVTWDRNFPYGCRALGFKTRNNPAVEVLEASGKECLSYMEKTENPHKTHG